MEPTDLDELYFTWLVDQVGDSNQGRKFVELLRALFEKEYLWVVPNDDNRAEDGLDLRGEFADEHDNIAIEQIWYKRPCSMLELLIGLSRRLTFDVDGVPSGWFWELVRNTGLHVYSDGRFRKDKVDEIVDRVIWRTYDPSGEGGLFPLGHPKEDQRAIELWDQLSAYVIEMGRF